MFKLPDLSYSYNALLPFIDEETMRIHHTKHHQAYVDNLNKALEGKDKWLSMDVKEILQKLNEVPEEIRTKVRNNAGGHLNHSMFWEFMIPHSEFKEVGGELKKQIEKDFNSFESFQEKFEAAGLARFGSGWVWLVLEAGKLLVVDTPNQDTPVSEGKNVILGLDVWEHSYYIQYKWQRGEYIKNWWNIVNWKKVEENFSRL